jgi:uncharacterized protein (TIGR03435 family)
MRQRLVQYIKGIAVCVACAGVIALCQPASMAQSVADQPAFEVASVKRAPDLADPQFRVDRGTLTCRMGLTYLISWAYDVPFNQVVAPDWARIDPADIQAKAGSSVGEDQVRLMLRALLAERYKLQVHNESREVTVAALMLAKGGPHLKQSESQEPWRRVFDGFKLTETFTGVNMAELVHFLAQYFNGLLDRTGLSGRYDFILEYRPLIEQRPEKSVTIAVIEARAEALRQVGLMVQPVEARLEFVVVDHLEKTPLEN